MCELLCARRTADRTPIGWHVRLPVWRGCGWLRIEVRELWTERRRTFRTQALRRLWCGNFVQWYVSSLWNATRRIWFGRTRIWACFTLSTDGRSAQPTDGGLRQPLLHDPRPARLLH